MDRTRAALARSPPPPIERGLTYLARLTAEGAPIFDRILQLGPLWATSLDPNLPESASSDSEAVLALSRRDVQLIFRSSPRDPHLSSCKNLGDVRATVAWIKKNQLHLHELFGSPRQNFPDPLRYSWLHYYKEPSPEPDGEPTWPM